MGLSSKRDAKVWPETKNLTSFIRKKVLDPNQNESPISLRKGLETKYTLERIELPDYVL